MKLTPNVQIMMEDWTLHRQIYVQVDNVLWKLQGIGEALEAQSPK